MNDGILRSIGFSIASELTAQELAIVSGGENNCTPEPTYVIGCDGRCVAIGDGISCS